MIARFTVEHEYIRSVDLLSVCYVWVQVWSPHCSTKFIIQPFRFVWLWSLLHMLQSLSFLFSGYAPRIRCDAWWFYQQFSLLSWYWLPQTKQRNALKWWKSVWHVDKKMPRRKYKNKRRKISELIHTGINWNEFAHCFWHCVWILCSILQR